MLKIKPAKTHSGFHVSKQKEEAVAFQMLWTEHTWGGPFSAQEQFRSQTAASSPEEELGEERPRRVRESPNLRNVATENKNYHH